MATAHDIPSPGGLLESILDQLSRDALASIAAMRPKAVRKRETFADQIMRMIHTRARARLAGATVEPSPDDRGPDELTRRAILDAEAGKDLARYADLADAFADLGI